MKKQPLSRKDEPSAVTPPKARHVLEDDASGNCVEVANFPVVGIGASAGGLEALESFFKNVPQDSGMAFIVVQHLDPTQKGILVELLQRSTRMPVVQAKDDLKVLPDHVYVIPPNKDLSLLHGSLFLFPPTAPRGLRLPIDFLFRSLADDLQERSVGVILSGMGSDGMLGLRAIKGKAGGCFVQDPATAKFNGMPRSSIDSGLADVIASADELPGRIIAYLRYTPAIVKPELFLETKAKSALEKVVILLRAKTQHDFSHYKNNTVYRRIERRMGLHKIDKISTYVRFLQENPKEIDLLFKELLIGVTSFFRDPAAWEQLRETFIPTLLAERPEGGDLRVWTTGCSTGEEAYSLAIVVKEALETLKPSAHYSLQIFATDLDADAIAKARVGLYPANIVADVSSQRLSRFFVQEEQGYRVGKEIRDTVVFALHNVIKDPPFTKLDILLCRNLLIYFDQDLQKKLLPVFHYSLNPGGLLFLGSSETIGGYSDLFTQLDGKTRFYRSRPSFQRVERLDFSSSVLPRPVGGGVVPAQHVTPNIQTQMEQFLLQHYAPAAVLANAEGDILYISGRTGKYLEPAAGKANLNIFAMARDGLRYELSNAFQKVVQQKKAVTLKSLAIERDNGSQLVDVIVQQFEFSGDTQGMIITVFVDIYNVDKGPRCEASGEEADVCDDVAVLKRKVRDSVEELLKNRQEMQAAQEELRSANEELQSSNEELTTSKEEMQSMNEELETVNNELQARNDELSRANNDMKNLLNSTDIATLFLDDDLNVRRFTNQIVSVINLIPTDVGRPITNITTSLNYAEMVADAREVLRTLAFCEKPISTSDGRWFLVRIMPYRTLDNRIDGVVITFTDISRARNLEETLRGREQEMKMLFAKMPNAFVLFQSMFDNNGALVNCRFAFVNEAFERIAGASNAALVGKTIQEGWPNFDSGWIKLFGQVVATGVQDGFEMLHETTGARYRCTVYRPGIGNDIFCVVFQIYDDV